MLYVTSLLIASVTAFKIVQIGPVIFPAGLTRIFHGKPIPTCGRLIPTALDLNFDWDGMKHTATASKLFVRLVSMGLALRLTTIYHEIFGLVIFPFSYIFDDILTEIYGYQYSRRVIWTGLFCIWIFSLVGKITT